jgi:hypothetical protein
MVSKGSADLGSLLLRGRSLLLDSTRSKEGRTRRKSSLERGYGDASRRILMGVPTLVTKLRWKSCRHRGADGEGTTPAKHWGNGWAQPVRLRGAMRW